MSLTNMSVAELTEHLTKVQEAIRKAKEEAPAKQALLATIAEAEKELASLDAPAVKPKTKKASPSGRRGSVAPIDLAPFREDGCYARSWNKGQGTQCPKQAVEGCHFCKQCQAKDDDACLPCGIYNEFRPTFWADTDLGASSATKQREDAKHGMPWKMDAETYERQFADLFGEADAEVAVELDDIIGVEQEEVAETLAFGDFGDEVEAHSPPASAVEEPQVCEAYNNSCEGRLIDFYGGAMEDLDLDADVVGQQMDAFDSDSAITCSDSE